MALVKRSDFPFLEKTGCIYLDTAATAQKPACVLEAMSTFYTSSYGTVHRGVYELARQATCSYHNARQRVQHFLGAAHVEEILFTRGATAALNLIARSFSQAFIQPGSVIVLSEIEHHSNLVPWQMVAKERGAQIKFIAVNERAELVLEDFERILKEGSVAIVSLAHISNVTGTLHPIKKVIDMAHAYGAKVCLDGAQSAPHLPIHVHEWDVDFFVASGHKLYGPTGIGIAYGKKELLERMPPIEGGGDMIETVTLEGFSAGKLPLKFEAGTPPIVEAIGLGRALEYLSSIGMQQISLWEQNLTRYALQRLQEVAGLKVIGGAQERGSVISFVVEGVHPLDIGTLLDCQGIAIRTGHQCSQPAMQRFNVTSVARLSLGLYNTQSDIDFFIDALQKVVKTLSVVTAKP